MFVRNRNRHRSLVSYEYRFKILIGSIPCGTIHIISRIVSSLRYQVMKPQEISYLLAFSVVFLSGVSFMTVHAQTTSDGENSSVSANDDSTRFSFPSTSDTWAGDYDERDATDQFEGINAGERVQVRLTNGAQIQGDVIGLLGDRIQIEISNERLTMSGTITLRSETIETITKLDPLTQAERRQVQSIKEQYQANVRSKAAETESGDGESETAGAEESTGDGDETSKQNNKDGETKKEQEKNSEEEKEGPPELSSEQQRLLNRFPAEEWTQKRYEQLKSKYNFQRNSTQDAFLDNWEKLQEAREIQEKRREYQLLQEFHPDDGWTPEKYRHINENLASLEAKGIPARSAEQRRFLDVYDEWKEAYDRYKKRQKKKKEEREQASSQSSSPQNEPQQDTSETPPENPPSSATDDDSSD